MNSVSMLGTKKVGTYNGEISVSNVVLPGCVV